MPTGEPGIACWRRHVTDVLASIKDALGDRYEVRGEVGRGGMATVFSAFDRQLGRVVAVKVIHPELSHLLGSSRFRREVSIAATLQHPNIVPVFEAGEAGDLLFYTMPLVEGESLRDRLQRETQLPLDEALRITGDVAEALHYAHEQGIVHRDIKPENILLHAGRAMVTDFGLARAIAHAAGDSITTSGLVAGTPGYMSPEQASGKGELDERTDVYSLACVLYEMLAGEAPFTGPSAQAIVAKQLSQPVPSIRVVRSTVPAAVDAIVQRGLAKVPADRFASAQEFAAALALPREPRRRPRLALLVAAAVLLAGGGTALVILGPFHKGGTEGPAAGTFQTVVHLGVLPVVVRGGAVDSGRVQLIQDLFVSELARHRGLAVEDPLSLNGRMGTNAARVGADATSEFRRLGLEYAVRITATRTARGLEVAYVLTDANVGNIVETGAFTDTDGTRLAAEVRQAGGRLAAALDAATGGLARGLDVEPFLARAPKPAAASEFLQGIAYTYRFLPGGGEHFRRASELDPDFVGPRLLLVSGMAGRGDTAAARAQVRVLESLKTRATPFEQAMIGWCEAVVQGDVDAKIRHLRVALGYSPHNNILLYNLAENLWLTGRPEEAVEPAREAMASGWRFAPLYILWAKLAIDAGEVAGLPDTLEEAQGFAAPDGYAPGLLEALALYRGDTSAARRYGAAFRAAFGEARIAAGYAELSRSVRTLAERAREQRRPATAVALLRRPVDGGVRQPILRLELARALAESGEWREAESYYRGVTASDIAGAEALAAAGDVAELLGRAAEARRDFTRYLEVAPGGPDAARIRERLRVLGRPSGSP
jgi:tetratricopeptide (TPR) repeat protein